MRGLRFWKGISSSCSTPYQVLFKVLLLLSILGVADFLAFKEMFVDYKMMKDRGCQGEDLSDLLSVSSLTKVTDGESLP